MRKYQTEDCFAPLGSKDRKLVVRLLALLILAQLGCSGGTVSFNAQVRPVLNKKCMSCHGGVKQAGGLSFLFREDLFNPTDSGRPAVVPGYPSRSELIRRVNHWDSAKRMPQESDPLEQAEVDVLESWIASGAEWERHWSYRSLEPVQVPDVPDGEWARDDIDSFILSRLREIGLKPSPDADRPELIRRVSLDLTGLPPTQEEVSSFLSDESHDAFERVVDRLLDSPSFGERWAAMWLDLARYADTRGYERDPGREIWLYRDWVIKAFNRDLPYDKFTVEQLAGDLLPDPTPGQRIATAFHRNTMNNDEGGTDNEEYRVAAVIDRVNTTWDVWMGTTFSCAQCHGHPFDPFRQEDYYRFFAFFNNTRDEDTYNESPVYRVFSDETEKKVEVVKNWVLDKSHGDESDRAEEVRWVSDLLHFAEPKIHPHNFKILRDGTHADTKFLAMYPGGLARLPGVRMDGKRQFLVHMPRAADGSFVRIRIDSEDGKIISEWNLNSTQPEFLLFDFSPVTGKHDLYFSFENPDLEKDGETCSISWLILFEGLPGAGLEGFERVEGLLLEILGADTTGVPILVENGESFRRKTQIFERGNWLVKGEEVEAGVPGSLHAWPEAAPKNRLGLAKWIVSPKNPLTARVAVNRFWEQLFGRGLVETLEDFGTQGAAPSHPELLDWLAMQFVNEHGWSVKKLLRQIVLSSCYRQQQRVSREMLEIDPQNYYLARHPRLRLSAEQVRDQALAVSGLLSNKMFGASVMPFQPDGVWQVIYSDESWQTSEGKDRHRRGIYTYWRRTSPYPSMVAFDSPSREFCVVRRIRTNTPLQALVTLNDPVYVEAAQSLALRVSSEPNSSPEDRIREAYSVVTARAIDETSLENLLKLYETAFQHYSKHPDDAREMAAVGEDAAEVASLTVVANTLLNLDQVLNK